MPQFGNTMQNTYQGTPSPPYGQPQQFHAPMMGNGIMPTYNQMPPNQVLQHHNHMTQNQMNQVSESTLIWQFKQKRLTRDCSIQGLARRNTNRTVPQSPPMALLYKASHSRRNHGPRTTITTLTSLVVLSMERRQFHILMDNFPALPTLPIQRVSIQFLVVLIDMPSIRRPNRSCPVIVVYLLSSQFLTTDRLIFRIMAFQVLSNTTTV